MAEPGNAKRLLKINRDHYELLAINYEQLLASQEHSSYGYLHFLQTVCIFLNIP